MAEKLTTVKIKYGENFYSDEIPVGALAENVIYNSSLTVTDKINNIDASITDIQDQIENIREVPSYSSSDSNRVLTVNSTGDDLVWSAGGGGSSDLPPYPGYDSSGAQKYMLSGEQASSGTGSEEWVPAWKETLPDWQPGDEGKVPVIVQTTSWEDGYHIRWEARAVPRYDYAEGKILRVSNTWGQSGPQLVWDFILPEYDSSNAGQVLSVTQDGTLEWISIQ